MGNFEFEHLELSSVKKCDIVKVILKGNDGADRSKCINLPTICPPSAPTIAISMLS